jgi:hypothetical protein
MAKSARAVLLLLALMVSTAQVNVMGAVWSASPRSPDLAALSSSSCLLSMHARHAASACSDQINTLHWPGCRCMSASSACQA